jgi:hypothetical protein
MELDGELSEERVAYLRRVLVTHHDQPETGVCSVCGVPRCRDWLDAYDRLAVSHNLMGEPSQWQGTPARQRP